MHAGNTASGLDEISPSVIKKAWPVYCEEITSLFQQCLDKDHHPLVFKNAIPCALPKHGKRCRALPRSYRLIALLSCLGKALERLVAKRLNNIALELYLISSLHFGAIARRSAVDAAATLTHDIKKYFHKQEILTALAFDIKGAFDRVIDYRLIQRLCDQKIPLPLICFSSLLNNRTAAIRLDGRTSDHEPVQIEVLQGSPVAPILFMIFTAPLFQLFRGSNRVAGLSIRGYDDDGLLTASASSEDRSTETIQAAFYILEKWALENGMVFDLDKFEAMHFSRKRNIPTLN